MKRHIWRSEEKETKDETWNQIESIEWSTTRREVCFCQEIKRASNYNGSSKLRVSIRHLHIRKRWRLHKHTSMKRKRKKIWNFVFHSPQMNCNRNKMMKKTKMTNKKKKLNLRHGAPVEHFTQFSVRFNRNKNKREFTFISLVFFSLSSRPSAIFDCKSIRKRQLITCNCLHFSLSLDFTQN